MSPMLLDPQLSQADSPTPKAPICSDSSVVPSESASRRNKELWWLHGHPHSKRYSNPALVSLGALVRHAGIVYRGQTAFLYPISSDAQTSYESMTWDEFDQITEHLAALYARDLQKVLTEANSSRKQPTIALIGGGRTIEYFCTQLALQKLGVRVLLLAESNAVIALHHLLDCCDVAAIITDSKNSGADTKGIRKLPMVETLPRHVDTDIIEVDSVRFQDFGDIWERHCYIIHSSGSTGLPKPIIHTNRSMMLIARMYRLFKEFEAKNWFLLFPLYHIAGISIGLSGLPNGQILSFPPLSWPPSSSRIIAALKTVGKMGYPADVIHCAPALIENMYEYIVENGGDFCPLASLKVLQPGGAALSDRIINTLFANKVNVKTTYGSTETGPFMRTTPHTKDNPDCYRFRNLYPDSDRIKMEEVGDNVYECIVYKGFELAAELWEGKPDDEPYRTNDLFTQEPPGSGSFVLQGRKDDILIHSNGEKTTAGPLQLAIETSSKVIKKVLVLGHSKPSVGLLVEVNSRFNPEAESTRAEVWETVKMVNDQYPSHSRILRSMIYMLPRGSSLPVTPKFNVKRKEAERIYTAEVERLYEDVDDDRPSSPCSLENTKALKQLIRNLFAEIAEVPVERIKDVTTLYELGVDSRLALSLRTSLSKRIGRISLGTIFENPRVDDLLAYYQKRDQAVLAESRSSVIEQKISKLCKEISSWPVRPSTRKYPAPETETVLLTGATGSLGTALLASLCASPRVSKIYAMVRGPNHFTKLCQSLTTRGLSVKDMLQSKKIEVINYCMEDGLLGLDIDEYSKLAQEVTMVVQNAWKMNFNHGVEYFEDDCIRNTISLLRLCHAGRPKTFAFMSSVSACSGSASPSTVLETPINSDPQVALNMGYAQSKYIGERVTEFSAKHLSVPVRLLRVGQLCGNTQTGHWNVDEMFPILFATSAKLGAIPLMANEMVDWIPVDVAGQTICDVLLHYATPSSSQVYEDGGKAQLYTVHNIVNPRALRWTSLISMLQSSNLVASSSSQQPMEVLPLSGWVARLNAAADSGASPAEIPGLRLLHFFESLTSDEDEPRVFENKATQGISGALRTCPEFREEWLREYVMVWRRLGFIE
ncbi:MAG: hypothetical protein M1818_003947 [Claussenomyces sp. TS43310]|nr:MAG: hypothetical protein M1818_003947 [Claussenomyces sp. TS43310]